MLNNRDNPMTPAKLVKLADDFLMLPIEVAQLFRVDPKTVTRWSHSNPHKLPSIRTPGGHRRFRADTIKTLYYDGVKQGEDEQLVTGEGREGVRASSVRSA